MRDQSAGSDALGGAGVDATEAAADEEDAAGESLDDEEAIAGRNRKRGEEVGKSGRADAQVGLAQRHHARTELVERKDLKEAGISSPAAHQACTYMHFKRTHMHFKCITRKIGITTDGANSHARPAGDLRGWREAEARMSRT